MVIKCYKNTPVNGKFECFDVLTRVKSILWTKRFTDVGSFEMELPASSLQIGDIIHRGEHSGYVCRIVEDYSTVKVYGYDLKGLLNQRYILPPYSYSGSAESIIKTIAAEVLTSNERAVEGLTVESISNNNGDVTVSGENTMASELVKKICETNELGYDIEFSETGLIFKTLTPTDKSKEIIFSRKHGNVENISYTKESFNSANVIYYTIDNDGVKSYGAYPFEEQATGFLRMESGITNENYQDAYNEKLVTETLEGEANSKRIYGKDYSLGDYVTVIFKDLVTVKQISEVVFAYEKAGNKIVPTFGNKKENIIKKLLRGGN